MVKIDVPQYNTFDLSYDRKLSCDMGELVPFHWQPILPGDNFKHRVQQMIRFAPLVAPVMHKMDAIFEFYFVPYRILWDGWEEYIASGGIGDENELPEAPYTLLDAVSIGSISDYLDLPIGEAFDQPLKTLAFNHAAYHRIIHEWYRDQNLQTEEVNPKWGKWELEDGNNTNGLGLRQMNEKPYRRAWTHDYFTSALPFAQKGQAVVVPIGESAPIRWQNISNTTLVRTGDGTPASNGALKGVGGGGDTILANDTEAVSMNNANNLWADLSEAVAMTINELRNSYSLQRFLEKMARGGSRYTEILLVHFGVHSSDKSLQRPQFLGGMQSRVSVSEIVQNSASEAEGTPQGNLAGHGISIDQKFAYNETFEEHGVVIGLMSIMPKPAYMHGLDKSYTKFDPLEYYWPDFAHLGEQEVKKGELYFSGNPDEDDKTFGFQSRHAEYKFNNSRVNGDFKDTLKFWHLGRDIEANVALNSDFIECHPSKRIFAVQDLPDDGTGDSPLRNYNTLYCHIYNEIKAKRKIPLFSTPR